MPSSFFSFFVCSWVYGSAEMSASLVTLYGDGDTCPPPPSQSRMYWLWQMPVYRTRTVRWSRRSCRGPLSPRLVRGPRRKRPTGGPFLCDSTSLEVKKHVDFSDHTFPRKLGRSLTTYGKKKRGNTDEKVYVWWYRSMRDKYCRVEPKGVLLDKKF